MELLSVLSEQTSTQKSLPPFTTPSYYRILRDKATGIAISIFRSLQSFFIAKPSIDTSLNRDNGNFPSIYSISKGGMLGNFTLYSYLQKLKEVEIDTSLLTGAVSNTEIETNLIAIPIILKGFFRNHIVTIFIDKTSHQIEFYDPKGLTIQDQSSRNLVFCSENLQTLENHVIAIWKNFATDSTWTFKESSRRHQSDSFNCGVYVSNFITRRLKGESFEEIQQNGLSFRGACTTFREEMIRTLTHA
jgi:hypothetical protein